MDGGFEQHHDALHTFGHCDFDRGVGGRSRQYENWIGQEYRQNALGQICCGKNDCRAFTVDEVTVMPDG